MVSLGNPEAGTADWTECRISFAFNVASLHKGTIRLKVDKIPGNIYQVLVSGGYIEMVNV